MTNGHVHFHQKNGKKILLYIFIAAFCAVVVYFFFTFINHLDNSKTKYPSDYGHESYVFESAEYRIEVFAPADAFAYLIADIQKGEASCEILMHLDVLDLEYGNSMSADAYSIGTNAYIGEMNVHILDDGMQLVMSETFASLTSVSEKNVLDGMRGETIFLTPLR